LAARSVALPAPRARPAPGAGLAVGVSVAYLSVVVLLPLAALVWAAHAHGSLRAVTDPQGVAALKLTLLVSLAVAVVQAFAGTAVAWTLVRDRFFGQGAVNALIDLPFALPTIVASLTLLTLYGPRSPVGVHAAFTRWSLVIALLFVTLPFVVRTVQPVLVELDREMEDAAAALGASRLMIFRRIVLPNVLPAILSGVALAFARAVGEFGSVVLVSGNIPFRTEVASVYVLGRIESGDSSGAAAVSVVLLAISFAVLLLIGAVRRRVTRHDG
jgi:sulfate/thiosulfate transport system permease protein